MSKGKFDGVEDLAFAASHLHTVWSVIQALSGKEPAEDTPVAIKGFYGIFGLADERHFQVLFQKLDEWNKDASSMVIKYLEWEYPEVEIRDEDGKVQPEMLAKAIVTKYAKNQFRTFVTKMDSSPSSDDGTERTTKKTFTYADGGSKRRIGEEVKVTDKKLTKGGYNAGLEFLKRMIRILAKINDDDSDASEKIKEFLELDEDNLEIRFKELHNRYKQTGVPVFPKNMNSCAEYIFKQLDKLGEVTVGQIKLLPRHLETLDTRVQNRIEGHKNNGKGFTHWLVRLVSI